MINHWQIIILFSKIIIPHFCVASRSVLYFLWKRVPLRRKNFILRLIGHFGSKRNSTIWFFISVESCGFYINFIFDFRWNFSFRSLVSIHAVSNQSLERNVLIECVNGLIQGFRLSHCCAVCWFASFLVFDFEGWFLFFLFLPRPSQFISRLLWKRIAPITIEFSLIYFFQIWSLFVINWLSLMTKIVLFLFLWSILITLCLSKIIHFFRLIPIYLRFPFSLKALYHLWHHFKFVWELIKLTVF